MKNTDFLNLMQEIDSDLIEKAEHPKKIRYKKRIWASAIAACLALGVVALPLAKYIGGTAAPGGVVQGTTGGEAELPTVIKLGESGKFTAYDTGEHAAVSQLNANREEEFKIETPHSFIDESKKDERKFIEINGRTWAGRYNFSTETFYYGKDIDIYSGIDPLTWEKIFHIMYNRETGELVGFKAEPQCFTNLPKEQASRNECYAKAMEFLNKIVANMDEYTLNAEKEKEEVNGYSFEFYRTVNGIKTMERISIEITGAGDISSYYLVGLDSIGNVDLSGLNTTTLNKTIDEKINNIYKNKFDIKSNYDMELCRLKDGRYYLYCIIRVSGRISQDGEVLQDASFLMITLD